MKVSVLDKMEAAVHPAVSTKFNGKEIIVIAKRLSKVELDSCGNFSLINLNIDKVKSKKKDNDILVEMSKYAEIQHKVLSLSLISPTYKEIEDRLLKVAGVEDLKERMKELVEKFNFIKDEKLKKEMEHEYAVLEFRTKFFMPEDFLIDMFKFATSQDISHITRITTEEILFDAAVLAKRGKCRPSDILCEDGVFTPHNKADIDLRAAVIFEERKSKQKNGKH